MAEDVDMAKELHRRAVAAGEDCGLYLQNAVIVCGPDGVPVRPLTLAGVYAVGARAFLPDPDVEAMEARRREVEWMEMMAGPDVEDILREADDGALGDLERGGA